MVSPGAQYWPMPAKGQYNQAHLVTTHERTYNASAIEQEGLDGDATACGHESSSGYGRNNDSIAAPTAVSHRPSSKMTFGTTYRQLQCTGFNTVNTLRERPETALGVSSESEKIAMATKLYGGTSPSQASSRNTPTPRGCSRTAWDGHRPRASGANCLANQREPPLRPPSQLSSARRQWAQ